jgi:RNase P subunit RPR2
MKLGMRICDLLLDREWHAVKSLIPYLIPHIRNEHATRVCRNNVRRLAHAEKIKTMPAAMIEEQGRRLIIQRAFTNLVRYGNIERRGEGLDALVRSTRWYCASCGISISRCADRPVPPFCKRCRQMLPPRHHV